jgi:hypothetical protein
MQNSRDFPYAEQTWRAGSVSVHGIVLFYWTKGSSWLSWSHHFESFTVATMIWLTVMEYLCHKWPRIRSTCRKHFLVLSSFMTYQLITGFVTRLTWRVPLLEQEPLTLQEHMSSPPVFSDVRDTRSLVLCVCFVDRCLSFCSFSFGHCVVCSSSIRGPGGSMS